MKVGRTLRLAKIPVFLFSLTLLFFDVSEGNKPDSDVLMPILTMGLHVIVIIEFWINHLRFSMLFYPFLAAYMAYSLGGHIMVLDTPLVFKALFTCVGLLPYIIAAAASLKCTSIDTSI
jgi:hypothetical protein